MHLDEMLDMVAQFQIATEQTLNLEPTLLSVKESNLRYQNTKSLWLIDLLIQFHQFLRQNYLVTLHLVQA